ncbi:MAG: 30S ribosomal protein S3 [Eubacteriales bacterium]|nr:30S ribosomal protein S3 [Eubacteriales bacterium]
MGQKVNPHGMRVGIIKDWNARWFARKGEFAVNIKEDNVIRKQLKKQLYPAGVSRIETERAANKLTVNIYTAKPGIVIGKGGQGVEILKKQLAKQTGKSIVLNIIEIKRPDIEAQLVAENIASQLERRISFRRAMKQCIGRAMKGGALGIKAMCSGRLGGAEIARSEKYHDGSIPLQTIRADIDYGFAEANTTYGKIGCKVWIYKGEILGNPLRDKFKASEGGSKDVNAKKG